MARRSVEDMIRAASDDAFLDAVRARRLAAAVHEACEGRAKWFPDLPREHHATSHTIERHYRNARQAAQELRWGVRNGVLRDWGSRRFVLSDKGRELVK